MAAPTYDSSGVASGGGGTTSLSYSHTVTGSNPALFAGIGFGADPGSTATASYNGSNLTQKGATTTATYYFNNIYANTGVATGAHTLSCSITGAPNIYNAALIGVSVVDVDQSSSFGTVASSNGASGQPSTTLTTAVDDFCLVLAYGDCTGAPAAGSGLTLRQEAHALGGGYGAAVATKVATGASETMNFTGFNGSNWLAQAIGFKPVAATGQTVTPGTASLTLSTFAPTITVSNNIVVIPGAASLTLAAFAPAVTASNNITVTPPTAILSLTAFPPTVAIGGSFTVVPNTAALSLAGYAPTVLISGQTQEIPISAGPMPWQTFWKRPQETYQHQSGLQVVVTISSRVTTSRKASSTPTQPDLTELKREILAEAQAVLRQKEAKQDDTQHESVTQAAQQRLQRQAEDDEELLFAASILFRGEHPAPSWTIEQPRRRYGRRRK